MSVSAPSRTAHVQPSAEVSLPAGEINWERLDKQKFFLVGIGLFSSVSACLYPITVVKTRLQVQDRKGTGAYKNTRDAYRQIWRHEGFRGFYRGFGTVIFGTIPARVVYLGTLESMKDYVAKAVRPFGLAEATTAGISNGLAGFLASVVTQTVIVPVDVVSQRLMVQGSQGGGPLRYTNGVDAVKKIVRMEGVRGLYSGFGASVLTYSPSSGIWWASYGATQRAIWRALGYTGPLHEQKNPSLSTTVLVQAVSGMAAGGCSAVLTTPLDVIKTRMQVLESKEGGRATFTGTIRTLVKEDGMAGFYRGLGPRWASMTLWGTAMVTTYEFLKRLSVKSD